MDDDFYFNNNTPQLLTSFDSIFKNKIENFKQKALKDFSNDDDFKPMLDKKFKFMVVI